MRKDKIYIQRFGIPIEGKRNHWFKMALLVIFLIAILCAVTLGVQTLIQRFIENVTVTNDLNSTWIGSLASYWGSIIGGIISGSLTVVGVAWTIKYYRSADASKNRIEHMPFLYAEMKEYIDKKAANSALKKDNVYEAYSKVLNRDSEEKILFYKISLQNIGQGFANTLVIYTGTNFGGIAYNELIRVNDSRELCLKIHVSKDILDDEISFAVRYIDCMTNEYAQTYTLQWKSDNYSDIKLENGYPEFICQTHAIGKS